MKIAVASGKGGTGKTFISASLAKLLATKNNIHFIDADAEEPNAFLFVDFGKDNKKLPDSKQEVKVLVPKVNGEKCTACGKCVESCSFNALIEIGGHLLVYPDLCHSCGACFTACPQGALEEERRAIGVISSYKTDRFLFSEGRLNVGEVKATPLVEETADQAGESEISIIDCPPGVSCSMMASVKNADYCLLVSENTPFGLHDLEAAVEVMYSLDIPFSVIINKWQDGYTAVADFLEKENIPLLMKIPFSAKIASLYSKQHLLDEFDTKLADKLKSVGETIIREYEAKQ